MDERPLKCYLIRALLISLLHAHITKNRPQELRERKTNSRKQSKNITVSLNHVKKRLDEEKPYQLRSTRLLFSSILRNISRRNSFYISQLVCEKANAIFGQI